MAFMDDLSLGFASRRLSAVLQTEAAECGLACLCVVAHYYGHRSDLASERSKHSISLKGTTLADLIRIAGAMQLSTRPLKLELANLPMLRRPCILHWNFDHYVVLKSIGARSVTILDPAFGQRRLTMDEFSASFTGIALELWPTVDFIKSNDIRKVSVRQLMGRVSGFGSAIGQVLALAAALEVFALVTPLFMQWVIDEAIVSADKDLLTTLALGFGLLMALRVFFNTVRSWVLMHLGTTLNVQWRANVFSHLMKLPVSYFQKRHIGDVVSRFGSVDQIQSTLTTSFVEAILDGLMSIATLVMMYIYSRVLGSIALATVALYGLCRWLWYSALRNATNSQIIFAAKQQSHFLESLRGIRALKLFQQEEQRRAGWLSILVDQINAGLRSQKLQIFYSGINSLLVGLENILIVWFGAKMVIGGEFSAGALIAFKSYDDQFLTRASGLIDKLIQFRMLRVYGDRLADIVLTAPEVDGGSNESDQDTAMSSSIRTANLRFKYAEHEPYVLDGVSFDIADGECVAIVGPSGCGKTTLVNILVGVHSPTSGDVIIGGKSIRQVGVASLRQFIGSVMQDDALFAGSMRENISFFDPNVDNSWVEECARLAGVHPDIVAMPMGYNSLVGDMGTVLSGGQKQRVLLARALYKRPRILILDEATSHLDVAKEREVTANIRALKITRLIIAHRPETIESANRILVLDKGRIVHVRNSRKPLEQPLEAAENPVGQECANDTGSSVPLIPRVAE